MSWPNGSAYSWNAFTRHPRQICAYSQFSVAQIPVVGVSASLKSSRVASASYISLMVPIVQSCANWHGMMPPSELMFM